jgi:transposase
MKLTNEDLNAIEAVYEENKWSAAEICRFFRSKKWNLRAVQRAIKRYKETGSISPGKITGRPKTVSSDQNNIDYVDEHCESQESNLSQEHLSCRQIAKNIPASKSTVHRIITRNKQGLKLHTVKRLHCPQMPITTKTRRLERANHLLKRFPKWRTKKLCFQDEKDFTLQVPTNRQNNRIYISGTKKQVDKRRLFRPANKQSLKVMVSCVISYNGVSKPFFMDPQRTKVTGEYYTRHLVRDLLPECHRLYPNNDFIYMQDGATSHTSNLCQNKLKELLGRRFINKVEWPPKSPDLNPLDYHFWNSIVKLVYENRRSQPFDNFAQLNRRIKAVWNRAINMDHIRKSIDQFRDRLKKVVEEDAGPITQYFG